jgi:hypothetical protein
MALLYYLRIDVAMQSVANLCHIQCAYQFLKSTAFFGDVIPKIAHKNFSRSDHKLSQDLDHLTPSTATAF